MKRLQFAQINSETQTMCPRQWKKVSSDMLGVSSNTAARSDEGTVFALPFPVPFILLFDRYVIIIFYKNASGDGSASPNAGAVKLSEEL